MKNIKLSLVTLLATGMVYAHDQATIDGKVQHGDSQKIIVEHEADHGEFFGQWRTFYVDRTYSGTKNNNRNSLATGGYFGYKSANFNGLSFAVAAYGTTSLDIHNITPEVDYPSANKKYDPSLFGYKGENYGFIGQAYINYAFGNTNIKVGRMRLDTPLAGADDARMLPNLFEAAVISNKDIDNTTLIAAHVLRETVGTFGNIYGGGVLGLTSGYGLGMQDALSGDFVNMGKVALGDFDLNGNGSTDNTTDGVTAFAAVYTGIEGVKLQFWDYIAWDILNAVYLQADYSYKLNDISKLIVAGQYIHQNDIGGAYAGSVKSDYFAAKVGATYGDLLGYVAYSVTGDDTASAINGGVLTPWGGMPAFTQGMVTRHQFFADTDSWKVAATYKFKSYGVKASVYYTRFDVGTNNGWKNGTAWTASESGWDIQYDVPGFKGLNLRARANYPRDFAKGLDWDEYRLIANYNF